MKRPRIRLSLVAAGAAVALSVGGCSSSPSTLDPKGPGASRIAGLWWFMFVVAALVVVVVTALVLFGALNRRRPESPPDETPTWATRLVIGGGLIFPIVVLSVLWVVTLRDTAALSSPPAGPSLTIDVAGHQWWWEVTYPGQRIDTANDIHVPVGEPVLLRLTTDDVLHSFWVPQLSGKTDMIAGRTNHMWIRADHPGVFRGQCAEFCGLQHANMAFFVVAQPAAEFKAWARQHSQPPAEPADALLRMGRDTFEHEACSACHTIDGTTAQGTVGPNLTDFGGRRSIGAGTVPNTVGYLSGWIVNSQAIKPGNIMPPIQLDPGDLAAIVAYLESLK
jgi:cytochrome c oxidase subunit 2